MATNQVEPTWEGFSKWWGSLNPDTNFTPLKNQYDSHPLFYEALRMNSSASMVVDLVQMKYLFMKGGVEEITGFDEAHFLEHGVQFSYSRIHPDDIPVAGHFSVLFGNYYRELPVEQKPNYRSYWDFRFHRKDGKYGRALFQDIVLRHTEEGNMSMLLSLMTDITSLKHDRHNHLRMTNGIENVIYEYNNIEKQVHQLDGPTERELDVFRHLSQGYQRKQVADKLGIGLATVKTHCQHVFEKLRTNDVVETINLLKVLGLL